MSYLIFLVVACRIYANPYHQTQKHFEIISNQFDSYNNNIDYSHFIKLNDNILHTTKKQIKYKLQQIYCGIPIFGATLVVKKDPSDINSKRQAIFGKYYNEIAVTQHIGKAQIKIHKHAAIEIILRHVQINADEIRYTQINSYIYYHINHRFYLVWLIYIGYMQTNEAFAIINAKNGDILKFKYISINAVDNIQVCGDGGNINIGKYRYCDADRYHNPHYHSLQVDEIPFISNTYFTMINKTQPFECQVLDRSDICYISDTINDAYCAVCDAYYHLTQSFEIYLNWLEMLPFAMDRYPIYVLLHSNISNAIYTYKDNQSMIILSDGDKEQTFPWVALDIVAHEVAHGFTDKAARFIKFGESLALEEAYSDLVGECTKYYVHGYNDWRFGANIMKQPYDIALRMFYNPSISNYKEHNDDLQSVRDLSGIYMHAFYVLNVRYQWSMQQLFKIMSTANLYYWTADSSLNEALCGIYEAIDDLYDDNTASTMKEELFDVFNNVGIQCIVSHDKDVIYIELEPNVEYMVSANQGEFKYYTFIVTADTLNIASYISIRLIPKYGDLGDADMYIAREWIPNDVNYECKSNHIGSNEECKLSPNLSKSEPYYAIIYGFAAFTDVALIWSISESTEIEWTEIMFNVPFIMEPKQCKYFYVILSEFDYKIGTYLTLNGLSSNANGHILYETRGSNDGERYVYDVMDTKPGTYYIKIQSNALHKEEHEFMVALKYKTMYEIQCDESVIIVSNDWNDKYLYFNVLSLADVKQLKVSLKGDVSLNKGAIDLYNNDGLLLCSITSAHPINECVVNKRYLNIGIYYIKYSGFVETELMIHFMHEISWNLLSYSSSYRLPININHDNTLLYTSVNGIVYLLDDYKSIYVFDGQEWKQNLIQNAPRIISTATLQNAFIVVAEEAYLYIFETFIDIYKFDIENNAFVENDIKMTDPRFEYKCIAADDMSHDIYFIGHDDHLLLMYNWLAKQWMFASNIDNVEHNDHISCAVLYHGLQPMLLAVNTQKQQIWSYTKQYDFWYLLPQTLTMNSIQYIAKTADDLLYLFGDSLHMQSIRVLNINQIEYNNETDLCAFDNNDDDTILFAAYSSASEWIVWSKVSLQTTQHIINNTENENENKHSNIRSNNHVFLYDISSMAMLAISYILIAIILISCQRKAILTKQQIRQKYARKNEDIENLPDL